MATRLWLATITRTPTSRATCRYVLLLSCHAQLLIFDNMTNTSLFQSASPDPNRQSYQQGPVPAAWAQHTGNSGHQVSQHTGSSGTGAHPQFAQHSGGFQPQQQQQPTTYYEASGVPVGAADPKPDHRGQLHELS